MYSIRNMTLSLISERAHTYYPVRGYAYKTWHDTSFAATLSRNEEWLSSAFSIQVGEVLQDIAGGFPPPLGGPRGSAQAEEAIAERYL
jgi:hypothetical protein